MRAMGRYYFEMLGTAIFAITGVLVVTRRGLDVFGALVLGLVTALGGGTARDLLLRVPVFWIQDINYLWAGLIGALGAFFLAAVLRSTSVLLLYLDALGAALFAVSAAEKVMLLDFHAALAVIMAILTGIGGGLVRDVLAGRPTLLMSRDIYATPILLGCTAYVMLRHFLPGYPYASAVGFSVIFGFRALAIGFHLQMPAWLTHREEGAD
jgi:uncharacterized membrane protein YeiH